MTALGQAAAILALVEADRDELRAVVEKVRVVAEGWTQGTARVQGTTYASIGGHLLKYILPAEGERPLNDDEGDVTP